MRKGFLIGVLNLSRIDKNFMRQSVMARRSMHRPNHQISTKTVYSTVEPTLQEKQLLPPRFRKADEWPVTGIIAAKAGGEYLVEWAPHPTTGAIWKPSWVCGFLLGINYMSNSA
jgi:hypothetical protein